jgi:hypothetical protein
VKLYVCYGTFPSPRPGGHPCRNAHEALKSAGHDPKVIRSYGLAMLPDIPFNLTPNRIRVKRWTGSSEVPVLVTDDFEVIQGSRKIVAWAEKHPA